MNRRELVKKTGFLFMSLFGLGATKAKGRDKQLLTFGKDDEEKLIESLGAGNQAYGGVHILWQGSNDRGFTDPQPADYVFCILDQFEFTSKPTHRYLRFVCSNTNLDLGFYIKTHKPGIMGGLCFIGNGEYMDLTGFDWEEYSRNLRRANQRKCSVLDVFYEYGEPGKHCNVIEILTEENVIISKKMWDEV